MAELDVWGDDPKLVELLGEQGEAGFRALFDGFPESVGVLWALRDDEGKVVDFTFGYGNPSILRAFRLPPSMRDRYTLLEALPRMRGSHAFDAYVEVCESGEPWVQEVTYDTPFGDGYMLGTFVQRTVKLGDGLINFLNDVTEQRRMEEELRNYAKVAAHDLREPLMAAGLFVQQLDRRLSDGRTVENEELLERVHQTHARARSLVDGILEYARSGTSLAAEPVDTGALVADVAASLTNAIDHLHGELEIADLPVVRGDRAQLGRVFQNLIANGLKFHADEPPRVAISAERREATWLFSVRDNGVGVPRDLGDEIFSMLKRAHGEEVEGCGIGLAVCRKIVESHGGAIWAEPADGAGTVMRFTVPAS